MSLTISALHIYPIKSLGGISLTESKVEARGLQYDRRWILINNKGKFLSQRDFPKMALLQPAIADRKITISHRKDEVAPFTFSMDQYGQDRIRVTIWDDTCPAYEVSAEASAWFTAVLAMDCRLVYMPDSSIRPADPRYAITTDDKVSFADGYPILIFDETSIESLSQKAGTSVPSNRFRANIITKGGHPHIEDELKVFEINGKTYHGVKPCARCIMTTIDQTEGKASGNEPLKTLANYRKTGHKIQFGQNVIPPSSGHLAIGDTIDVKETNKPIAF